MHLNTHNSLILIGLSLLTQQLANAQSNNGACVQSCINAHPISSTCNGDETGQALEECTCASFSPGNALIPCVQACPTDQQTQYAEHLPALCRGTLFPNLSLSSTAAGTTAASTQTTGASSMTATSAAGSGSTASNTASASSSATPSGNGAGASVFDVSSRGWAASLITGVTALFWYL